MGGFVTLSLPLTSRPPADKRPGGMLRAAAGIHRCGRRRALLLLIVFIALCHVFASLLTAAIANPNHPARIFAVTLIRKVAPIAFRPFRSGCHRYRSYEKRISKPLRFGVALQLYPPPKTGWTPEFRSTYQLAERNRLEYCRRHGYEFLNGTLWAEKNLELVQSLKGRNVWLKSLYLLHILGTRCSHSPPGGNRTMVDSDGSRELDYIFFLDADAIIMDLDRPLDALFTNLTSNEKDAAVVASREARDDAPINAGGFLIPCNSAGMEVMQAWSDGAWENRGTIKRDQPYFNGLWKEQILLRTNASSSSALTEESSSTPPRLHLVPPCALQSVGGLEWSESLRRPYFENFFASGDFAVHFAGRPDKVRQMEIAVEGSMGFLS